MKRILICILSVLLSVPSFAQDDPVVMTVNGYDVKKSEFEYFFRKNNTETRVTRKTIRQYAELYLNFKLKVQAAMDEGLDKSESFIREYNMYRDMQAQDYLIDNDYLDAVAHEAFQESLEEVGPDGLAMVRIMVFFPEEDTEAAWNECSKKADSVYDKLRDGVSFAILADENTNDDSMPAGGELGWMSRAQLPQYLADIVFSLVPGQYTEPFAYEDALMILQVDNRRKIESFESEKENIYKWINEDTDFPEQARIRRANEYADKLGWTIRGIEAFVRLDSVLEEVEPEFGNISREYHDGLLMFDISNREVWEKASMNQKGMEEYFNTHRKDFRFKEPAFRGMVFFCTDEDVFNQVKKTLEGVDIKNWVDSVISFNKSAIQVRVMRGASDTGLFRKGQNAYVDKLVFGTGQFEPMKNYPYVNVVGNRVSEPESMNDVRGQVLEAFQKNLEDEWVKRLRSKYTYKINKKALKKVNLDK
ncbi:MAG: peptidylprolyl isomerase [Bacteroidaceae bacterium]|nr:peptidylprolyl isomerase [Bacteroidaceae bacterium]